MCSDNKDQISANPSGDEPMAHIGKGCTALDGVGVVPSDTTLKQVQQQSLSQPQSKEQQQPQPQSKNATEYVTYSLSYAYNVAKDTFGSVLGTYQTSTTTEKAQDQKTDK